MIYRGHNKEILHLFCQDLKAQNKIICVSGYFDPPHPDHLSYMREAKALGDFLIVILNTDRQLLEKRKGTNLEGVIRYPFEDRVQIINEFKPVDLVVPCMDEDTSVAETLRAIAPHIFAKGGDRTLENLPQKEKDLAKEVGYEIICGVGHPKEHSSSWYNWEGKCRRCGTSLDGYCLDCQGDMLSEAIHQIQVERQKGAKRYKLVEIEEGVDK